MKQFSGFYNNRIKYYPGCGSIAPLPVVLAELYPLDREVWEYWFFVLVVTSLDRKNSMHLMRAEVPGPEKDKLVPKAMSTARILYGMYLILTVIEMVFLVIGGMNLFDSMIFSFGSAGTGGFSNYADSVAHF